MTTLGIIKPARIACIALAFASLGASQWRTGYFLPNNASGQTAASIPWSDYTHVVQYAVMPTFKNGICGLDTSSGSIEVSSIKDFVTYAHAAGVKAIIGVSQDADGVAILACTTPQNIATFVALISAFAATNQYDGVDIEWGDDVAPTQYWDLVSGLRTALPSATLSAPFREADTGLIGLVEPYLDQINVMTRGLDIYAIAPLRGNGAQNGGNPRPRDTSSADRQASASLYILSRRVSSPAKVGLGIPFYGRIYQGCLEGSGAIGVTSNNQVSLTAVTNQFISYADVVKSPYWGRGVHVHDESHQSDYISYFGGGCTMDALVEYTGTKRIAAVLADVVANKFGGIMTFGLPYEYLPLQEGNARYPLSTALANAIVSNVRPRLLSQVKPSTPTKIATPEPAFLPINPTTLATGPVFTYYVDSVNGADSNPGTQAAPWKTIAKVNSATLSPGQSVGLARGGVWRETLKLRQSGNPTKPISIGAYGTGQHPLLNGSDLVFSWAAAGGTNFSKSLNLKAFWKLAEASGDRSDSTTNANTLTTGGGNILHTVGPNANVPDGASLIATTASFLARKDADLTSGFPGKSTTSAVSVSVGVWVNPRNETIAREVVNKGCAYGITVFAGGTGASFTVFDNGYAPHSASAAIVIPSGSWTHIVGTWNLSTGAVRIYINGRDATSSVASSVAMVQDSNSFQLGKPSSCFTNSYFDGAIAEPFAFSSLLSPTDVSSIYNFGIAGALANIYLAPSNVDPNQVFQDNERLIKVADIKSITAGSYYWDSKAHLLYICTSDTSSPLTHIFETSGVRFQGIDFNGKSFINVDSIDVTKAGQTGYEFGITSGSNMVTVSNAVSSWNGQRGFRVGNWAYGVPGGDNITFSDSISHDNLFEAFWFGGGTNNGCTRCEAYNGGKDNISKGYNTGDIGGILFGSGAVDNFIKDSYIHDIYHGYLLMVEHENHANVTKPTGAVVSSNTLVNNVATLWTAIDEQGEGTLYEYNTIYSSASGSGNLVTLDSQGGVATGPINASFYNNTLYLGAVAWGNGIELDSASGVIFENNIVATAHPGGWNGYIISVPATGVTGFVSAYNFLPDSQYFYKGSYPQSMADWRASSGLDNHSVSGDPLFVDASNGDFILKSGSRAIQSGSLSPV